MCQISAPEIEVKECLGISVIRTHFLSVCACAFFWGGAAIYDTSPSHDGEKKKQCCILLMFFPYNKKSKPQKSTRKG